jgi:hypothetical protein
LGGYDKGSWSHRRAFFQFKRSLPSLVFHAALAPKEPLEYRENFLLRWELMPAKTLVGLARDWRSRDSWRRDGVRNKAEEVILMLFTEKT